KIKQQMKREPRFWVRQRWWIIYHALLAPRTAQEIARQTGVSVRTVRRVIARYNCEGERSTQTPGSGGRRYAYLTMEQERTFLQTFATRAERGELATVAQIQQAFEAEVGHRVHKRTIHRLLARHGWRKLVPRPRHPKANLEEQAAFLKNFPALVQA